MMQIDSDKEFNLMNPLFDDMRSDLAIYVNRAPRLMEAKQAQGGVITLKIGIALEETTVKDENGTRKAIVPTVNYKLDMSMQTKVQRAGAVVGAGNELVQDNTGRYFILTKEEASGQLSMFNGYED